MANTLGEPYRILYISRGVMGLQDVRAVVLKPDNSQAGVFPMEELPGLFRGCYYYDYLSSTSDPTGSYFSKVTSPSENVEDITRFQLDVGGGDGSSTVIIPPTNLVAYIMDDQMTAEIQDTDDVWAYLRLDELTGTMDDDDEIVGQLSAAQLNVNLNSASVVTVTE